MRTTALAALLHLAVGALAQEDLLPKLNTDNGLWVEGYDPVSYLVDQRAVEGDARYTYRFEGATFRF